MGMAVLWKVGKKVNIQFVKTLFSKAFACTELETQVRKLHTLDATSTRTQNEGNFVSKFKISLNSKARAHITY